MIERHALRHDTTQSDMTPHSLQIGLNQVLPQPARPGLRRVGFLQVHEARSSYDWLDLRDTPLKRRSVCSCVTSSSCASVASTGDLDESQFKLEFLFSLSDSPLTTSVGNGDVY